jgi:hypothetical protein
MVRDFISRMRRESRVRDCFVLHLGQENGEWRPGSGMRDLQVVFSQRNESRGRKVLSGGTHPGH